MFLLFLFLLTAYVPALAAPQNATLSDASAEDVIEYEDPEGLVHLEPKFEWTGEDRFLLSFRVSNRTDVMIPETEMILQFSGEEAAGASFDGTVRAEPEEYPGTVLFTEEQSLTVLLKDVQPGEDYLLYAEGTVPKESAIPVIQAFLILRGYGLEHSTESRVEVPDRAVAEEPEEEITVLLVVRLLENGKKGVPAQYAYIYENRAKIYTNQVGERAARKLHFLPYTGETGSRNMSFPVLAAVTACVMFSTFAVMNHFLVKHALRQNESRKAG